MSDLLTKLGKDVKSDVNAAKKNGCVVEHIKMGDTDFVYRSLNRTEWKTLQTASMEKSKGVDGSIDPEKVLEIKDESEDAVVMVSLLHPKHETAAELSNYPAGYVSQLADRITELSGFGELDVEPTRL